ncbi:hypothetical protein POTOM_044385 [Populus tomentosa]|uniref:S-locus glycoprotein domain-containing protein n=1 Tax=Populus tomentosa TaxID=118781 RepID=A0A8X8CEH2_POPTO|nr:hypothetical protein POTOM_044385 [Populus tomentosa]
MIFDFTKLFSAGFFPVGDDARCFAASVILWESLDFPTDTLLAEQPLVKDKKHVSSRSSSNYSSDDGVGYHRRLKIDFDGNLRLYSQEDGRDTWVVSWQALSQPCKIHGTCGPNSYCSYVPDFGRKCSCPPGF